MTLDHLVLLFLLFLPLAGAILVWLLGPNRGDLIRWVSLGASVTTVALALVLAARLMSLERKAPARQDAKGNRILPTFRPEFVPGASSGHPHATTWDLLDLGPGPIQFYIGVDGLNIWLVVLT